MRKITFLLLVAALTIPAAASLAKTPPPKTPRSVRQQLIAKNSAKFCKALMASNEFIYVN